MEKNTVEKSGRKAIFLDRDGVLTREKSYVATRGQMEIFPYAKACIDKIKEKGYLAIVVTNQSGVARGIIAEEELVRMNRLLIERTGVDAVYYCPHYEKGIIAKYAKPCNCRKPQTGMIDAAVQKYGIDLTKSYMVGDRAADILMGQNAGVSTVLLESGYGTARLEEQVTPDYIMRDLRDLTRMLSECR